MMKAQRNKFMTQFSACPRILTSDNIARKRRNSSNLSKLPRHLVQQRSPRSALLCLLVVSFQQLLNASYSSVFLCAKGKTYAVIYFYFPLTFLLLLFALFFTSFSLSGFFFLFLPLHFLSLFVCFKLSSQL